LRDVPGHQALPVLKFDSNGDLLGRGCLIPARGPNDSLRSRTTGPSISADYTPSKVYFNIDSATLKVYYW
jgi:hypothetical protein